MVQVRDGFPGLLYANNGGKKMMALGCTLKVDKMFDGLDMLFG